MRKNLVTNALAAPLMAPHFTLQAMAAGLSSIWFVESMVGQMIGGGAKKIGGSQNTPDGNLIVDMVDPSGFPIRAY